MNATRALPAALALAALSAFAVAQPQPAAAAAKTAAVEGGNIVLVDGGKRVTLTKSGHDSAPALSPDGAWVYYTHSAKAPAGDDAGDQSGDCLELSQPDQLRRVKADGTGDELVLTGKGSQEMTENICVFDAKQFSSDGKTLYFLTPAWTTSSALHAVNVAAKTSRYILPANDYLVLAWCDAPELHDALVVNQHRYFQFGGSYDWYWLFDPTGSKELGAVGEHDDANAVREAVESSGQCQK